MSVTLWCSLIAYLVGAPLVGGVLAGCDRRLSARMQARRGPPILQPFYDVFKLWRKQNQAVHRTQNAYVLLFLIMVIFTGGLFFVPTATFLDAVQADEPEQPAPPEAAPTEPEPEPAKAATPAGGARDGSLGIGSLKKEAGHE